MNKGWEIERAGAGRNEGASSTGKCPLTLLRMLPSRRFAYRIHESAASVRAAVLRRIKARSALRP